MKLVIVESPAKVKTIRKYLGKEYKVAASMGHLVDLPKKDLGVDIEKKFTPTYKVTNRKALKMLKDLFEGVDTLVIASDPDREGEAIGWHVAQRLGVIGKKGLRTKGGRKLERIVFTSITKDAVLDAIKHPRSLDFDLIDAQQTRRILDRLVGYTLSPLLWKKIQFGLSAGRVQSVAVRLIVDREEERERFKNEEYWSVSACVSERKKQPQVVVQRQDKEWEKKKVKFTGIKFELVKIDSKRAHIADEKTALDIIQKVRNQNWIVSSVEGKGVSRYPKPPFITSTLQRIASSWFGFSAKKTMMLAQRLYERGHITYMRTDSTVIVSPELSKIRSYIEQAFGKEYVREKEVHYKTTTKSAQEAHEAIRPTSIQKEGHVLKLHGDEQKLYDLIRQRTLASQMSPAKLEKSTVQISIDNYMFQAIGQRIRFDGYLKVYTERVSENILPKLEQGQQLYPSQFIAQQHFTLPPPRYSEATLIKALERYGIGRPSTYAPIISTILARKYVIKEAKYLVPTDIGRVVTKLLKQHFADIVDTGFTAGMEADLDYIASGEKERTQVLENFYKPFIKKVKEGEKQIQRDDYTVLGPSDYVCPKCGKRMVKKLGRFGSFFSCSNFPTCDGIRSLDGKSEEEREKEIQKEGGSKVFLEKYLPAPQATDGTDMILREGRYGKFWAHSDYPKIKEVQSLLLKEVCPQCGSHLVERKGRWGKSFVGCSGYPKCRYIKKAKGKKRKPKKRG